jgi:hypothetical protein
MIHRENAARFAAVRTLDELRSGFTAGFGAQWADLSVLTSNGFRVVTVAKTGSLYPMLQARRFDFFHRGINEVWGVLEQRRDVVPDVIYEEHLALYYPLVQCFVVARTNAALAERIRKGLERMLADGSMKRLFLEFHQPLIDQTKIPTRKIFKLTNPSLPLEGPRVDTRWWLSPPP